MLPKLTLFSLDRRFSLSWRAFSLSDSLEDRSDEDRSSVILDLEDLCDSLEEELLFFVEGADDETLDLFNGAACSDCTSS